MVKVTVLIFLSISILFAKSSLESKIAKLQTLPKEQRFKLMNEIKRDLAKMNARQRSKALHKLRASIGSSKSNMHKNGMHSSRGNGYSKSIKNHIINKTHMQEHMQNGNRYKWRNKTKNKPKQPQKPHNPNKLGGHKDSNGGKKGSHGK